MTTSVLIAGAGPVGLTAALMMARHGTPLRIIDVNEGPTTLSKALVVWRRTLQVLDPALPWQRVLEGHIRAERGLFFDSGKPIAELPFESGDHGMPAGVFIPQCDTEQLLTEALAEHGVQVERSTKLESFEPGDEGVVCSLSTGETLQTPWLIGCDGAHSTVRHTLDLAFPGETVDQRWLLADIIIDGDAPQGAAVMEGGPQGPVALFPISENRWRVIASAGERAPGQDYADPTVEDIQRVIDTRSAMNWTIREALWLGQFGVNERQIASYVHGRVLLAGDAAHVHSPAGGQGMNTGMQHAANLAWKVSLVERGAAARSLIDTYQAERHPIGAAVVKYTGRMLKAAMIENSIVRSLRGTAMHLALSVPALRRKVASALTEDVVCYRNSPLAGGGGTRRLRPGDALPDRVWGDVLVSDALRGGEALHISDADAGPAQLGLGGFPIRRVVDAALVAELGGQVLVRPDGVIAAMGEVHISQWVESLSSKAH